MMTPHIKKKSAFTLVELVVVNVILGILSGISSLTFQNNLFTHKEGVAKANLRLIKSTLQMIRGDRRD